MDSQRTLQTTSSKSKIKMVNRTIYNSKAPSTGNLMVKKNMLNNKFHVSTLKLMEANEAIQNTDK